MQHLLSRYARVIIRPGYLRVLHPRNAYCSKVSIHCFWTGNHPRSNAPTALTSEKPDDVLLGSPIFAPTSTPRQDEFTQVHWSPAHGAVQSEHFDKTTQFIEIRAEDALSPSSPTALRKNDDGRHHSTSPEPKKEEEQEMNEQMAALYTQLNSDPSCLSLHMDHEMTRYYTQYLPLENWWQQKRSIYNQNEPCQSDTLDADDSLHPSSGETLPHLLTREQSEDLCLEPELGPKDLAVSRYQTWQNWLPRFQAVYLPLDASLRGKHHSSAKAEDFSELVEQLGLMKQRTSEVSQRWSQLPVQERDQSWAGIMLWLMQEHPDHVIPALYGISAGVSPPRGAVLDVALYLVSHWWQHEPLPKTPPIVVDRQVESILKILRLRSRQEAMPNLQRQKLVYLLAPRCSISQLRRLYERVSARLTAFTHLHIAQAFGRFGEYGEALAVLRTAINQGVSRQSPEAVMVLTSILRHSLVNRDGYHANAWIIQQALQQGIALDIHLHNTLMINSVDAGDYETTFKMFSLLEQSGVRPDDHTYAIVLTAARRAENRDLQRRFLSAASRASRVNSVLANEIFVTFCQLILVDEHWTQSQKRAELIRVYCDLFDAGPLIVWGIVRDCDIPSTEQDLKPLRLPTGPTLVTMFGALIRSTSSGKRGWSAPRIISHWNRLKFLIRDTSVRNIYRNLFASLTITDHVQNLFLLLSRADPNLLEQSTLIVKSFSDLPPHLYYLPDGSLGETARQIGKNPRPIAPPPTSARTFTTLMGNYNKHGQYKAAQLVFNLMRERGLERDETTWEKLFSGLTEANNLEDLAIALNERLASGNVDSESIGKILGRVRNIDGLEKIMSEQKMASEASALRRVRSD